jgi:uncharacterized protein
MNARVKFLISHFELEKHPEGGYFRETYRSPDVLSPAGMPPRYPRARNASTSIYYLLEGKDMSVFHRLRSDETWYFHEGNPLAVYLMDPANGLRRVILGSHPVKGEEYQCPIPAGTWFAAHLLDSTGYAFIGCNVAPGFDFEDFEIGKREELLGQFPQHGDTIRLLTKSDG